MTVHAQLKVEDFIEASAAVRAQKVQSLDLLPTLYLFIAFAAGSIIGHLLEPQIPGQPRNAVDIIVSSIPLLLASAYVGFIALRLRGKPAHGFVRPPPPATGAGGVLTLVLCVAVFVISVLSIKYTPQDPPLPSAAPAPQMPLGRALAAVVLPILLLVAVLAGMVWVVLQGVSNRIARSFDLQVNLHEPRTFEISDEFVTASDSVHQNQYRWEAFIGWHETPNTILLYRSYISFELIPKRSFESFAALGSFLQLLAEKIGQRRIGFEVLNPGATPPVRNMTIETAEHRRL